MPPATLPADPTLKPSTRAAAAWAAFDPAWYLKATLPSASASPTTTRTQPVTSISKPARCSATHPTATSTRHGTGAPTLTSLPRSAATPPPPALTYTAAADFAPIRRTGCLTSGSTASATPTSPKRSSQRPAWPTATTTTCATARGKCGSATCSSTQRSISPNWMRTRRARPRQQAPSTTT